MRKTAFLWIFAGFMVDLGYADDIDFGRQVRPILAKRCFTCHGPDEDARAADLRLDDFESASADLGGYRAVDPGNVDASELMVRITSDDADLRMPPSESSPPLSPQEIEILSDWIRQGGEYSRHWAFAQPVREEAPSVTPDHDHDRDHDRTVVDRFVTARLDKPGLTPSGPADRETLIRRLFLTLLGITPTLDEIDRFVGDDHPAAYQRLVDGILARPEYGERFARPWLDLARYADTNGYEKDRPRTMWPFRDWVIKAINADMPFDQFSIRQIAGDMIPGATLDDLVATGFHRNTMLNEEGGIDPLEYRYYAVVDRVATTGTVWMGLTTGCAQCHTHKYDPITHDDYFSLFALLNNADEPSVILPDDTVDQRRGKVKAEIQREVDRLIAKHLPPFAELGSSALPMVDAFNAYVDEQAVADRQWTAVAPADWESTMPILNVLGDGSVLASGDVTKRDVYRLSLLLPANDKPWRSIRLETLPHDDLPGGGPGMAFYEGRQGDFFLSELRGQVDGVNVRFTDPSADYGKISVGSGTADPANVLDGDGSTGWSTSQRKDQASRLVLNFDGPIEGGKTIEIELLFERHFAAALGHFRFSVNDDPEIATAGLASLDVLPLASQRESWTAKDYRRMAHSFVMRSSAMAKHRKAIAAMERRIPDHIRAPTFRQRIESASRETHRHHRGEYLRPKELVDGKMMAIFRNDERPIENRLDLAKWLVSPANPLAGRVQVNREWRSLFGTGLVSTDGDFGTQSEPPSHPKLLDRLAVDWMDGGWSRKRLHRDIVASATFRRSTGPAPAADPQGRLLATFPNRRMDAEQIRDAFLSASALLTRPVGGPSVYPPQPESVMSMAYSAPKWQTSEGADRYRRSLYTFAKRTAPFAASMTFDGPTGESCVARRARSTTPLQALTLLNDAMFVEIAEGLAAEVVRRVPASADDDRESMDQRIDDMFRRLIGRNPDVKERESMRSFLNANSSSQAKWAWLARALMNTDEAITIP